MRTAWGPPLPSTCHTTLCNQVGFELAGEDSSCVKGSSKKKKKHLCVMTSFGGLFGLFFFFLRTSEMSLLPVACPVDVFLTFISQCLSFIPPFFSHSRVSRSFLIHRQHPTPCPWLLPLFPSLCLSGKLCLPRQSPCRLVLCGFCADSGVGFEGKA